MCSIGLIFSYKINVGVIYIMLSSLMPLEETGETRVKTDCLNFDFPLCVQIKKQIPIRGRRHWDYIFVEF